jgi:DNA repair protein RadC
MNSVLELPPSERPRERCLQNGADCLSLRECLGLVVGSLRVAQVILEKPGEGFGEAEEERALFTAMELSGRAHLHGISGLGEAGQARLLAAFELSRRYSLYRDKTKRAWKLRSPSLDLPLKALAKVGLKQRNESKEWLGFVPVYRSDDLGELCVVERGVKTHVNVDPGDLFARILALRPQGFVLFHNHPTGNCLASPEDMDLTRRVSRIASQLGIRVLGHWIVTPTQESWIEV